MSRTSSYLPTLGIYFRARRARPGAYRHPKGPNVDRSFIAWF